MAPLDKLVMLKADEKEFKIALANGRGHPITINKGMSVGIISPQQKFWEINEELARKKEGIPAPVDVTTEETVKN